MASGETQPLVPPSQAQVYTSPTGRVVNEGRPPPYNTYQTPNVNPVYIPNQQQVPSYGTGIGRRTHQIQGYIPVARNNYNIDNTAGYIYLALALIMSVLFSFTGILAVGLLCTIPAAIYAKQAISAREDGRHEFMRFKVEASLCCNIAACVFGSICAFLFSAGVITVISMTSAMFSDGFECSGYINDGNGYINCFY